MLACLSFVTDLTYGVSCSRECNQVKVWAALAVYATAMHEQQTRLSQVESADDVDNRSM